jgi:hypothetical protein
MGIAISLDARRNAMLPYIMIGALALLVFLSMAGDVASYSGKKFR